MTDQVNRLNEIIDSHKLNLGHVTLMDRVDQSYSRVCEALSARVAELEADKLAIAQKFDELHPNPALMARIIMTSIERENENIGLKERAEAAENRLTKAISTLESVETWWLEQGMKESVGGAPACIFKVRSTLEELKGQNDE